MDRASFQKAASAFLRTGWKPTRFLYQFIIIPICLVQLLEFAVTASSSPVIILGNYSDYPFTEELWYVAATALLPLFFFPLIVTASLATQALCKALAERKPSLGLLISRLADVRRMMAAKQIFLSDLSVVIGFLAQLLPPPPWYETPKPAVCEVHREYLVSLRRGSITAA